jgi:hypothetical protein
MAPILDMEVAFLTSLYVILIQALGKCQPRYVVKDDVLMEGTMSAAALTNLQDCALVVSTAALYDYHLSTGLICFDNELRYWVKPCSTT